MRGGKRVYWVRLTVSRVWRGDSLDESVCLNRQADGGSEREVGGPVEGWW